MNTPRTWFITGAGRGLGVELAKAALAAGHNVVAAGRNTGTVAEAIGAHDHLLVVRLDITDPEQTDAGRRGGRALRPGRRAGQQRR